MTIGGIGPQQEHLVSRGTVLHSPSYITCCRLRASRSSLLRLGKQLKVVELHMQPPNSRGTSMV